MLATCLRSGAGTGLSGIHRRHEERDSRPAIKNLLIQGPQSRIQEAETCNRAFSIREAQSARAPFIFFPVPPAAALVHAEDSKMALKQGKTICSPKKSIRHETKQPLE